VDFCYLLWSVVNGVQSGVKASANLHETLESVILKLYGPTSRVEGVTGIRIVATCEVSTEDDPIA
jgi:uncharacterized RmlC-like cupin family protein